MRSSVTHREGRSPRAVARPGRRAAIASLSMVPALGLSFVVAELLGAGIQAVLDVADGESLRSAGIPGVAAGIGLTVLLVVPAAAGILLGLRARRLGEPRLGTSGVVVNAVLGGYLLLVSLVQLLLG